MDVSANVVLDLGGSYQLTLRVLGIVHETPEGYAIETTGIEGLPPGWAISDVESLPEIEAELCRAALAAWGEDAR